jgi:hypothetical protein
VLGKNSQIRKHTVDNEGLQNTHRIRLTGIFGGKEVQKCERTAQWKEYLMRPELHTTGSLLFLGLAMLVGWESLAQPTQDHHLQCQTKPWVV